MNLELILLLHQQEVYPCSNGRPITNVNTKVYNLFQVFLHTFFLNKQGGPSIKFSLFVPSVVFPYSLETFSTKTRDMHCGCAY